MKTLRKIALLLVLKWVEEGKPCGVWRFSAKECFGDKNVLVTIQEINKDWCITQSEPS